MNGEKKADSGQSSPVPYGADLTSHSLYIEELNLCLLTIERESPGQVWQ